MSKLTPKCIKHAPSFQTQTTTCKTREIKEQLPLIIVQNYQKKNNLME